MKTGMHSLGEAMKQCTFPGEEVYHGEIGLSKQAGRRTEQGELKRDGSPWV